MPGRGLAFQFTRYYDSSDAYSGPLGKRWKHSYDSSLAESTTDGSITLRMGGRPNTVFSPSGGGDYSSPAGVLERLHKNADSSFTLTGPHSIRMQFGTNGRIKAIADSNGNSISFAYDSSARLSSVTDTVGRVFSFAYDTRNRLTAITDSIGRTLRFSFDAGDNLVRFEDPLGKATTYAYDTQSRMTSATDRRGFQMFENTFDASGRATSQKNARGFAATFDYDGQGNLIKITAPLGGTTQMLYDGVGRLTQLTDQRGKTSQITYDAANRITRLTDPLGNSTHNSLLRRSSLKAGRTATSLTRTTGAAISFPPKDRRS